MAIPLKKYAAYTSHLCCGIFRYAQYDKSPLSALRATFPEGGSEDKFRVMIKFSLILTKTFFLLPPSGEVSAKPTIGDKSPLQLLKLKVDGVAGKAYLLA